MKVVEDDIRKNLEAIGITVNTLFLNSTEYIDAELNGEYNLLFTRTWGAPYDPHSYLNSWAVPSHVEYSAIGNFEEPLTREDLLDRIEQVQKESDPQKIQSQWRSILEDVHKQAIFMPLWGTRIPYVLNRRLIGFRPGNQAYSLPANTIKVNSGSKDVTVAPGVGSIFRSSGPINPHQYSPNQLWAQDWIYDGLVSYGQDGLPVPALAKSWEKELVGEGERFTFALRENVTFHDGTPWNCEAAKLNFDHVLSDIVKQRHQWLGITEKLKSWSCAGNMTFVLETNEPFYPLLQVLSYIRPLRFASPSAFAEGIDSHPDNHNSCEPGDFGSSWGHLENDVTCLGLTAPIGTGPFKYVTRTQAADGTDASIVFARNPDYWGEKADIETLTAVQYEDTAAVEAALKSNELDMALGAGPLSPSQVQDFKFFHSNNFDVQHSDVIQHALLVFNTNRAPTDDIRVRQAIIHAIDKATFLEAEFSGLEEPVSQLLPRTAPFCDIDLSPKWGYDVEKAVLLNCPDDDSLSGGAIAGIAIAGVVVLGLVALIARMIHGERTGKPLFVPPEEHKGVDA